MQRSDHETSDVDELLEDDLELVNENIGLKRSRGRVQLNDDEEEDVDRIRNELFGHDEFGDAASGEAPDTQEHYDDDSRSDSDQSDDPFIVQDDEDGRRRKKKKKGARRHGLNNQCLDDAREIFDIEDIEHFYDDEGLSDSY